MVDIGVKFGGLDIPSPVGVSAQAPFVPPAANAERLAETYEKHVKAGAGFVLTGYTCEEETHPEDKLPTGRFLRDDIIGFGTQGMYVAADTGHVILRLNTARDVIKILKKKVDVPVIGDIMALSGEPEPWAALAEKIQSFGADGVELDISCPLTGGETSAMDAFTQNLLPKAVGVVFGDIIKAVVEVAKETVKRVDIPVGIKLDPQTGFPRFIALANGLKGVGVKWVCSVNAPFGIAPPDIYTPKKSPLPALDHNTFSAILGPWNRWMMYRDVAGISLWSPGLDIFAVGGLLTPEHVIQTILLGAKICGFSTGIIMRGRSLITRTNEFLKKYMDDQGYNSLEDFRGISLENILPVEKIDWKYGKIVSSTNENLCNGCGICADSICPARSMEDGVAKVKEDDCGACSMCAEVCPTGACTLIDHDTKEIVYRKKIPYASFF